ncbi:L-2-amino-thiazoline-4-carboxylic acid hydrolase [Sporobacter termitidis DSM 10068]|uniref:L-2-amino-thiazoline-4-carboxylic acid hydrolase n=1 Tax=Sporobacter termitidis DSM 10068 TaxID=1123282 RepID=A0A1M5XBS5_9FIRM|nr:L-2-amino-thiazoline-4-carboxylic acid hydrolase [Sporobacter termitidis]SHH97018.1 L-2-amino-thiazoline-4-carboxylic acid hydrolase [Sporobacter termitidis DSM 10068]
MSGEFEKLEAKIALDAPITRDEYKAAVKGAIQARSAVTYFIWKTLKEMYPEADATAVLVRAYEKFGAYSGSKWGDINNAAEALTAQTSKGGYLAFEQEFIACGGDYAQKDFHCCPHIEMFRELGATDEEIKILCRDILSAGDYGNMLPHDGVRLEFKKQIGMGDDHCEYCVYKCR